MSMSASEVNPISAFQSPVVGQPVLVSFFDGNHNTHLSLAHVLSVGGIDPETGRPTISVAYPDPAANPTVLASAAWYKGYARQVGVQHVSHPEVQDGKLSIAYVEAMNPADAPEPFIPTPAGLNPNPVFHRPVDIVAPEIAQGLHGAPALRSELTGDVQTGMVADDTRNAVATHQYTDGATATGATGQGPLPLLSPNQQDVIQVPLQPLAENFDKVRAEDEQIAEPSQSVLHAPVSAQPAQDAAIDAADLNAHNSAVAADQAARTADDAQTNAEVVHNG